MRACTLDRLPVRFLLPALLGVATCAHAQGMDPARAERIRVVQQVMAGVEQRVEKDVATKPTYGARDIPNAVLMMLRAGRPAPEAEALLQHLFDAQKMDPSAPDFGTVPWTINNPDVKDANAIEFSMQPMGAIFIHYGDKLSASFKAKAKPHLQAALVAMSHHNVKVSYTNIFLMNTLNTIQLAQYLGDADAMARGRKQWDQWRAYTAESGIHEFDSPTYYGTDLADLTYGDLYIQDPALHQQIVGAEALLWIDICTHYLRGAQRLSGAHSRDYYFLTGRGNLEMNLYMEGLFDKPDAFTDPYPEKVAVLENERTGAYHPSREILALVDLPERNAMFRFDTDNRFERYTYLTQNFSVGTAVGYAGGQDRMFVADIAGLPVSISVMPDESGSPYGLKKSKDKSGHSKPHHLPANLSAAQDKGLALLVFDLDPRNAKGGQDFETSMTLPAHPAEMTLNGKAVKPSASLQMAADADSVVALRGGATCFAARVFQAEPLEGRAATYQLRADPEGWDAGAIRFAAQHTASPVSSGQQHLHVTMLVEASACGKDGLAAAAARLHTAEMSAKTDGGDFVATATVGKTRLEVREDLAKRLPTERKVNGVEMPTPVFQLNGKPVTQIVAAAR